MHVHPRPARRETVQLQSNCESKKLKVTRRLYKISIPRLNCVSQGSFYLAQTFRERKIDFHNSEEKYGGRSARRSWSADCRALEKFLSYFLLLLLTFGAVSFLSSVQRFHGSSLAYQFCELSFGLCNNDWMMASVTAGAAGLFFLLKS
jgi:hypothetical protein